MVSANGVAIVIAIDVSTSMMAEDMGASNRIELAKEDAVAFVRGRKADRIGLVTFAGEALTQVPVTLDYTALVRAIRAVEIGVLEDGTAIGSGLAIAVARLRKVPGASKVILLLTDGVNNRGLIDPRTAAETAAAFGIRVYTVGIGSQGEARMPTRRDATGGFRYEVMPVEIDEALLRDIAQRTGGEYFPGQGFRGTRGDLPAGGQACPGTGQRGALHPSAGTHLSISRCRAPAPCRRARRQHHWRGARPMTFEQMPLLIAAPVIAALITALAIAARRRRVQAAAAWSRTLGEQARQFGRWSPALLAVTALAAGTGLAGPRWGSVSRTAESRALNIVIVMDVSKSMLAEDVAPNRLGRAVSLARRLIQDLGGDRFALVAFAGHAYLLSPLTLDESAIALQLDALDPDMASAGGSGLAARSTSVATCWSSPAGGRPRNHRLQRWGEFSIHRAPSSRRAGRSAAPASRL